MGNLRTLTRSLHRSLLPLNAVFFLALVMVFALPSAKCLAQERLPGVIDRPAIEVPGEVKEPRTVEPQKEPEMVKPEGPELVATLKHITFSGDVIIKEKYFEPIVARYLNRPLTRDDIARLKFEITKLYYDKGYVLVKVTTPPQDLTDGVLNVAVYAGRIGEVGVEGEGLNPKVARALSSGIVSGKVFNERVAESAVKNIDDIDNVKARLNLRPGKEFGTTDLLLTVEPAAEDNQQFIIDNYGSDLTGDIVATLDLKKSNLLGIGESFELIIRKSDDDLETFLLDFKTPIGIQTLKLELNYLRSENGIGDRLAFLQASGETERFGVALSGTLINMIQRQLAWRAGVEVRRHESFLAGAIESRDDITQAFAESSYLVRTPKYVFYTNLRATRGVDFLGSDPRGDIDESRSNANPQAWRFIPTLYANWRVTDDDFIQAVFIAQLASAAVPASDLFIAGGYGSVRGFQPAQETGDSGAQLSIEYAHRFLKADKWEVKAGPFVDAAAVENRVPGSVVDPQLYSAGIGVEAKASIIKAGDSVLRFDWARTLGEYSSTTVTDNTFYLRFTQNFAF